MTETIMAESQPPVLSPEVIEGFRASYITAGIIGHVIDTGFVDPQIKPLYSNIKIVGPAVTVHMPSIDTSYNRQAAMVARPGDVVVVDSAGDTRVARWGEMICFDLKTYGVEGLVIDGAVSASRQIREMQFPVFARSISALVGRRVKAAGAVNVPVNCGGIAVHPGDLIVGDDDGVVVIPFEDAPGLLEKLRERFGQGQHESRRRWILSGRRYADYPGPGWEDNPEYKS